MSLILGPDGLPIDSRTLLRGLDSEPQTAKLGAVRREWERHPARGITPASLAGIMQRAEEGDLTAQLDLVEDMEERDAHLYAEMSKRRGAVAQLPWSIEPPDNATPEEEALTELVRDWIGMLTAEASGVQGGMEVLLGAMTGAVLPGFAPIELQWRLVRDARGREVRIPHCTAQPQRWMTLSPDRRRFILRSQTQRVAGTDGLPDVMGEELRPWAWLLHVHPARTGYLSRMSLGRVLFWPYLFKNFAVRDLAEFLEIYGLPLRLGKYPSGASDAEKLTLLRAVTEIGHNAAGIIPQGMALDFQAAAAGTEVPFAAMWDRMDAAESKAILGQTLTASEGQHGTQALGKVHEGVMMRIVSADARLVEGSFARQLIAPLCAINVPAVNMRRLPRLELDTGQPEDMKLYAEALPKLVELIPRIPVSWARERLRIPEAEDGEEVLERAVPPPAPGVPPAPGLPPAPTPAPAPQQAEMAGAISRAVSAQLGAYLGQVLTAQARAAALAGQAGSGAGPAPDLIDALVDEQAALWEPMLAPMIAPLVAELDKALAAGESIAAFSARLPQLVAGMNAGAFTEQLGRAAFSARLAGEAGVRLDTGRPGAAGA